MDKFIMIVEPKAQEEIAALGFAYTITNLNGKKVYAFADTEKLQKYLAEKYSDEEWHYMKRNHMKGGRSENDG